MHEGLIDLESAIQAHVQKVLGMVRGGKIKAARLLGISRGKLLAILKRGPYSDQVGKPPNNIRR